MQNLWLEGFRLLVDQTPAPTTKTDEEVRKLGKIFSTLCAFEPALTRAYHVRLFGIHSTGCFTRPTHV